MDERTGGWAPHPDGAAEPIELDSPVPPARVVAVGALITLAKDRRDPRAQSFKVVEFTLLEDGRRVALLADRGFTFGSRTGRVSDGITADMIRQNALAVVLPDERGNDEDHRWTALATEASRLGLDTSAQDLRAVPYDLILGPDVVAWLDQD